MGHISHKSLDVLKEEPASGVDYTGDIKNCSTFPLGKSARQLYPKQATYNVLRLFQLVSVDTLRPFTPKSLGGIKYAVKFVDQQTKWREVVFMKDKACSVDALAMFVKETAIPRATASIPCAGTAARNSQARSSISTVIKLAGSAAVFH